MVNTDVVSLAQDGCLPHFAHLPAYGHKKAPAEAEAWSPLTHCQLNAPTACFRRLLLFFRLRGFSLISVWTE
jgi:hypothetical protein